MGNGIFEQANIASLRAFGRRTKWKVISNPADAPKNLSDGISFDKETIAGYVSVSLRRNPWHREVDISVDDAVDGETYTIDIEGTNYSFTAGSSDDETDIASALATDLDNNASEVNASNDGSLIEVGGVNYPDYSATLGAGSLSFSWEDSTTFGDIFVWAYLNPIQTEQGTDIDDLQDWRRSNLYTTVGQNGKTMVRRGDVSAFQGLYLQVTGLDGDAIVGVGYGLDDFYAQDT